MEEHGDPGRHVLRLHGPGLPRPEAEQPALTTDKTDSVDTNEREIWLGDWSLERRPRQFEFDRVS